MSSVVDDRVVRMRFDGNLFLSAIAKASDALERFKSKLSFSSVQSNIADLNRINVNPILGAIASVEQKFSALGIAGQVVVGRITNKIIDSAKSIERATIGQIKSGGWSRAMNIANAQFQIEGLGYSWEKVEKAVSYGVKDTAYGLDAAAAAASQLAASGLDFEKIVKTVNGQGLTQMHRALRAISGVAAMTNSSYEDISRIFTTVSGNGRLMSEQLLMLSSRGLNAAATLGKVLKKSEKEIRDMVSGGEIDFVTFANAMDDAFGDHAKEANKTFTGAMSNMKAALSRIGAIFATPVIEKTNTFFIAITGQIDKIKAKLSDISNGEGEKTLRFASHFAEAWEAGINAASKVVESIDISWFDKIANAADFASVQVKGFMDMFQKEFFPAEEISKDGDEVAKTADKVGKASKKASKDIKEQKKSAESLAMEMRSDLPQAAKDAMLKSGIDVYKASGLDALPQAAKDAMAKAGVYQYEETLSPLEKFFGYFKKSLEIVKSFGSALRSAFNFVVSIATPAIKALKDELSFGDALTTINRFSGYLKKFAMSLRLPTDASTKLYTIFVKIIRFIKGGLSLVFSFFESVISFATKIVKLGVFSDAVSIFKSLYVLVTSLVSPLAKVASVFFRIDTSSTSLAKSLKSATSWLAAFTAHLVASLKHFGVFEDIAVGVSNVLLSLKKIFTPIVEAFKSVFSITDESKGIAAVIKLITGAFANLSKGLVISDDAMTTLYSAFVKIFTVIKKVGTIVSRAVKFVLNSLSAIWDSGLLQSVGKKVKEFIDNIFGYVENGSSETGDSIKKNGGFITNLLGNMSSALKNIASGLDIGSVLKLLVFLKLIGVFVTAFVAIGKIVAWGATIATWPQSVAWMLGNINGLFLRLKKFVTLATAPTILLILSKVLLGLAASVVILGSISHEKLEQGILGLGAIIFALTFMGEKLIALSTRFGARLAVFKAMLPVFAGMIASIASMFILLAVAFDVLSIGLALLATTNMDNLAGAMIAFVASVMVLMAVIMVLVGVIKESPIITTGPFVGAMIGIGVALILLAAALAVYAGAIVLISAVSVDKVGVVIGILGAVYIGTAILISLLSKIAAALTASIGLINATVLTATFTLLGKLIMQMAGAIDMILAAVAAMTLLDTDKLGAGIDFLLLIFGGFAVMIVLVSAITNRLGLANTGWTATTIIGTLAMLGALLSSFGTGVALIIASCAALVKVKTESLAYIVDVLIVITGAMAAILLIIMYFTERVVTTMLAPDKAIEIFATIVLVGNLITTIASAMAKLMRSISSLSDMGPDAITNTIIPLFGAVALLFAITMAIAVYAANAGPQTILGFLGVNSMITSIGTAVSSILSSFKNLSDINAEQASAGITAVIFVAMAMIAIIGAASLVPNTANLIPFAIAAAILGGVLVTISAVLLYISSKCEDVAVGSVLKMIGVLAAAGFAMIAITTKIDKFGTPKRALSLGLFFLMFGISMAIVAKSLDLIQDTKGLILKAIVVIVMLAAITGAMILLARQANKMGPGGASAFTSIGIGFMTISAAILLFAIALKAISEIGSGIWPAMAAIGIFLAVLTGLAALVGNFKPVADGFNVLSTVFISLGIAVLAAGAGVLLFCMGLERLGPALAVLHDPLEAILILVEDHLPAVLVVSVIFIAVVIGIAYAIGKLAPAIVTIGEAIRDTISAIVRAIGNGMTRFNGYFTSLTQRSQIIIGTLIGGICAALMTLSPEILDTIGYLLIKLLKYLGSIAGDIAEGLVDFLIEIIYGLEDAIMHNLAKISAALTGVIQILFAIIFQVIGDVFGKLVPGFGKMMNGLVDELNEEMEAAREAARETDAARSGIVEDFAALDDSAENSNKKTGGFLSGVTDGLFSMGDAADDSSKRTGGFLSELTEGFSNMGDAADKATKKANDNLANLPQAAKDAMVKAGVYSYSEGMLNQDKGFGLDAFAEKFQNMNLGDMGLDFSNMDASGMGFDISNVMGDEFDMSMFEAGNFNEGFSAEMFATGDNGTMAFLDGFTMPDTYQSAADENMSGVEDAVEDLKIKAEAKGRELGTALAVGLENGRPRMKGAAQYLLGGITEAVMRYTNVEGPGLMDSLCESLYNAFCEFNKIESPSKLYMKAGSYIVDGVANGIDSETKAASNAMDSLGECMIVSFGSPLETIAAMVNGDIPIDPSIRPVVDMSSVHAGASSIDGMFRNQNMSISGVSGEIAADIGALDNSNLKLIEEMQAMRAQMEEMTQQINGMQVVMDSGALVGEITAPIDRALGQRALLRGRR